MAYFPENMPQDEQERYEPEAFPDEMQADDWFDEDENEELRRLNSRSRWRVFAGISDFFGVIAGTVVILILIALLLSLGSWLLRDVNNMFALFGRGV